MGAFGELLIRYWGGDLDRYRGISRDRYRGNTANKTSPVEKNNDDYTLTEDESKRLKIFCYNINKSKLFLDTLTSNLMYKPEMTINYTEESVKSGFSQLGLVAQPLLAKNLPTKAQFAV